MSVAPGGSDQAARRSLQAPKSARAVPISASVAAARGGGQTATVTSATGELIAGFGRELRATITEGLAAVGQRLRATADKAVAAAWEDVSR
jgi:hypothetical protein